MSERNPALLLGTYELTGKLRAGKFIELRFVSIDENPLPLDRIKFEQGGSTVIVISDKHVAGAVHDEEVYRIWMEKVE
jgi:hypothetical protein